LTASDALDKLAISWYLLAGNTAGYPVIDKAPTTDAVEDVVYYIAECPGVPSNLSITSLVGKEVLARFTDVLSHVGLRISMLKGIPPDSVAYVFALAGILVEAERLGDTTAPVYRLWLIEEVIEKIASVLEESPDYCSSLLAAAIKALLGLERRILGA